MPSQASRSLNNDIAAWESEGGAARGLLDVGALPMTGTASQVEWAERIRRQVDLEFDRVAASFQAVAERQTGSKQADTEDIIGILEDKRIEVMNRQQAGYFIQGWQEITDQVRQMVIQDARYQVIKSNRACTTGFEQMNAAARKGEQHYEY